MPCYHPFGIQSNRSISKMPLQEKPRKLKMLFFAALIFHLFLNCTCNGSVEGNLRSDNKAKVDSLKSAISRTQLLKRFSQSNETFNVSIPVSPRSKEHDENIQSFTPGNNISKNPFADDSVQSTSLLESNVPDTIPDYLHGKHESFFHCTIFTIEPGEYELFPNGTLYVEAYNLFFNESMFFLVNDSVNVCEPKEIIPSNFEPQQFVNLTSDMTQIGLSISIICLTLHILAFILVKDLRNLPGYNLAALCMSLIFSYSLMFIQPEVADSKDICVTVALLTHFFLMSSVLWMSIMSLDVFMSLLRVTGSLRVTSTEFKLKKFGIYLCGTFGIAFSFTLLSLLADISDDVPKAYKPNFKENCWFSGKISLLIFFAAPVLVLTCLNLIFFILSSYIIHANKMRSDEDNHKTTLRRNYLTYFRLSAIMGVTWVVGIGAAIVHASWLWYIFVTLNTFQGLYIFLAFTCSKKVVKFFRQKWTGGRLSSQQTLSPTFQSYCFYANSIEKDLDKVVDSKDKTDTIVIHL